MPSEALMVQVERRIYLLRGEKVMLASYLADLYGVSTSALNQAVRRNRKRFPSDFMFQLTAKEWESLKSHFVTSKRGGVRRALPYAFTEHGVAMLSSVLTSDRAAAVKLRSCARLCGCGRSCFRMPTSRENWTRSRKNTMLNSESYSTRSAN